MSLKKIQPVLQTVGVSAIMSLLVSVLFLFLYFHPQASPFKQDTTGSTKTAAKDAQFTKYETIINNFLDTVRKGQIEATYKGTSPVFQKLTSLDDFKKLIAGYQAAHAIPSSSCSLTEYSEPFSSSIQTLPDTYMIVETKCEVTEGGQIKGFNVEFIDDKGTPKISYINVYQTPVTHKK